MEDANKRYESRGQVILQQKANKSLKQLPAKQGPSIYCHVSNKTPLKHA